MPLLLHIFSRSKFFLEAFQQKKKQHRHIGTTSTPSTGWRLKIFILRLQQHGVEETAGNAQLHQVFTIANFCLHTKAKLRKMSNEKLLCSDCYLDILLFFTKQIPVKSCCKVVKFGCWVSQLRYASELKVQERRLWPQWPGRIAGPRRRTKKSHLIFSEMPEGKGG